MDKQTKVQFSEERPILSPSSSSLSCGSTLLSSETSHDEALTKVLTKLGESTRDSAGVIKLESLQKRLQETDARKREGGEAYIQHLEEEVRRLTDEYWEVKEEMVLKKRRILTGQFDLLKLLLGADEGNQLNKSRSEPVKADGEHGG